MLEWLRARLRSLMPDGLILHPQPSSTVRPPQSSAARVLAARATNLRPSPPILPVNPVPAAKPDTRSHWADWLQQIVIDQREDVVVPESLSLAKLVFCSLPARLTVMGSLDLQQCQRLRRIGDGLTVHGDLFIGGFCGTKPWYEDTRLPIPLSRDAQPPLRNLPRQLTVSATLVLRKCHHLTSLPDDINVASFHIEGCHAFETLPEEMSVKGDLTLKGCPRLRVLPKSLKVGGHLRLIGLPLDSLPDDLQVGGDLELECLHRLTELPEGLVVGRNLIIRSCPLTGIHPRMQIGKNLVLRHCKQLESLPENLPSLETLLCRDCPKLQSIPQTLIVRHSLTLTNCASLTSLTAELKVPQVLNLRGCTSLSRLPPKMRIGWARPRFARGAALVVADCENLHEIPFDLRIDGAIDLAGSSIKDLPRSLSSVDLMWRGFRVDSDVVFHPERLNPERILNEQNAEIRRLMLDRVGCEGLLKRVNAKTIDQDQDPGGERRLVDVKLPAWSVQPRRFLLCHCPSTARAYLMRVPPAVPTCHAAAAWLAGFDDPNAYRPIQET